MHICFDVSIAELKAFIDVAEKEGLNSIHVEIDKEPANDDVYGFILTAMDDVKYQ